MHNHGTQTLGMHLSGMTLRDYFAANAMQGLFAAGGGKVMTADEWAAQAYLMADAMLKARGQG